MNIEGLGIVMGLAGTGGLGYGVMQTMRAGRLAKTPFVKTNDAASRGSEIAGDRGAISVEGAVSCAQPLISPVTGTPCLFYRLEVIGSWKNGDKTEQKHYIDEKRAAAFSIDDGSGPVAIDASEGGDFPLESKFNQEKKEGAFDDLKGLIGKNATLQFGNYTFVNPAGSVADKFRCTEYVVPVPQRMFAAGRSDANRIIAPKWAQLILSTSTRDAMLGKALKHKKYAFTGGGSVAGLGAVLFAIGAITGIGAAPKKPAAAMHAAAIVAPAEAAPEAPAPATAEETPTKAPKHHGRKSHH